MCHAYSTLRAFQSSAQHLPKAPSLAWEAEMEVTYDEYVMTE